MQTAKNSKRSSGLKINDKRLVGGNQAKEIDQ